MRRNKFCHAAVLQEQRKNEWVTKFNISPLDEMDTISQTDIFKCIFMNWKCCVLIRISLEFVPKGSIDKSTLVQVVAWRRTGGKPSPESMLTYCLLAHMWRYGNMMTSSNGNIFRVTGHLCGEFTGPRWIPHTKASDAELWCFLWSASE